MRALGPISSLALLAAVVAIACQPQAAPVDRSQSPVGVEWTLVELEGQPSAPGAGGRSPTLLLSSEGSRISGFAGCNRMMGSYELEGDSIRFTAIGTTKMACDAGMDLEQRYAAALGTVSGYRIAGGRLELLRDTTVVARFEAK